MIVYIYDGTFEGLLTSIYDAYYSGKVPQKILKKKNLQQNLLDDYIEIITDNVKSQKVYTSIKAKISSQALRNVFYVFLSEHEEIGMHILNYLKLGWKVGWNIDKFHQHPDVAFVRDINYKVLGESHRMLGLLRFKSLEAENYSNNVIYDTIVSEDIPQYPSIYKNGVDTKQEILYASFEPDFNITGILAVHFSQRLSNENWIIHDVRRSICAIYNKEEWFITDFSLNLDNYISENEKNFQQLWKKYFKSISIKERKNPKLQVHNMPKRYWNHLVEFE